MSAFSLHAESHPGAVCLAVSDLGRALGFYGGVLGFRTLERADRTAVLTADGRRPLLILTEVPGAQRRPPRSAGLYHFAVLLPGRLDLARSLRRLRETGYPLGGCSDHLVSEALYLEDPDGNGIEIYRDRPRSEWPRRAGKIWMTVDPLDLEELLNEGRDDDRPWSGLPEAARIGHVHLHVADLGEAEAFYRDALGLEVTCRYGSEAVFLSAGGYHHHVGLNTWAGRGAPPPPPDAAGLRYFTFSLPGEPEFQQFARHLEGRGVSHVRFGGGLFLRDPSQNGVAVVVGPSPEGLGPLRELALKIGLA